MTCLIINYKYGSYNRTLQTITIFQTEHLRVEKWHTKTGSTTKAYPYPHHQKRRVAINEEPIAEAHQSYYIKIHGETETETGYQNGINYEAEAFIQHEHKRMELAELMSSRKATCVIVVLMSVTH
ncbi:hypothetical protein MtrunA17_Chr8g0381631 [Medicago truncatula]|uniref:Uncharacterized protein n=1 Tax=Medicago truncatula TaxID=3880 RepID=A0A396GRS9_MEDTR|nr:hypothetical protein MtrunA17_Chr8g0381631 [Medicago truncatula]